MLHHGILGRLLSGTTHAPPTNTAHRWQAVTDPNPTSNFRRRARAVVAAIATGMDNTAPMPATSDRMLVPSGDEPSLDTGL